MGETKLVACRAYPAFGTMHVVDACICTVSIAVNVKDACVPVEVSEQTNALHKSDTSATGQQ